MADLRQLLVSPDASIRAVMACIDRNAKGIALVASADRRLIGTVTDGDIRRAILAGLDLDRPVSALLERKAATASAFARPLVAPFGTSADALFHLMNEQQVRQIPLVDAAERVVDLVALSDLARVIDRPMRAVVMAGGLGSRLRPLTEDVPKPMLPIGNRPLMEWTVQQLRESGIRHVQVTTHYRGEQIASHFGDGRDFGVEIKYVEETQPLGTAGALSYLEASDEPVLVINGDILTRVDYRAMLEYHRDHRAEMTVAVRQYEFRVPYGVVETEGTYIRRVVEKPVHRHFISAGIYLMNADVLQLVPAGCRFDMPDLITRLVDERRSVVSFPIHEYWLDIGRPEDYEQALADIKNGSV